MIIIIYAIETHTSTRIESDFSSNVSNGGDVHVVKVKHGQSPVIEAQGPQPVPH